MAHGNGKDAALAISELRRRLANASPKERLEILLEGDAQRRIQALPATDLYYTVQELGLADSLELVQLASPDQFRSFVDLGGWKRDEVDAHQVLTWLRAARGEDSETFLQKVHGIDLEILEIVLRRFTIVHDLEENPDAHPTRPTMETPEGRYLLELTAEGVDLAALRLLLTELIAENPFEAVRMIEATRWEVPSELEETARRFRVGRLEDLGFPPLDQALGLFTRVDLGTAPKAPAAALAVPRDRVDFIAAALAGLDPIERENAEDELRAVINAVVVAEVADPGDLDAIRRATEMAHDYLSLGFEYLTGADKQRAADVLRDAPMRRIFQVGFTLTLDLKFRADRLVKEFPRLWLLDEDAAAVAALRRKRPLRALRVPGAEPVAFRSRRELAESEAGLERAGRHARALDILLDRFAPAVEAQGVDRAFGTVLAGAVLGGTLSAAPIPRGRLVELAERLFEGTPQAPVVRLPARDRALAVLQPGVPPELHPDLRFLVDRVMAHWLEEMGRAYLTEGTVDPKLVSSLAVNEG